MNKALFLDRDGVINQEINYAHKVNQIQFIPGIFELVKKANEKNYRTIIITNQAGIAKGYFTIRDFINLMKWMKVEFQKRGAKLDNIYFCPHHPDAVIEEFKKESHFRKPASGMLLKAKIRFDLIMKDSFLIGDRVTDLEAGKGAKVGTLCLLNKNKTTLPFNYHNLNTLYDALELLV